MHGCRGHPGTERENQNKTFKTLRVPVSMMAEPWTQVEFVKLQDGRELTPAA